MGSQVVEGDSELTVGDKVVVWPTDEMYKEGCVFFHCQNKTIVIKPFRRTVRCSEDVVFSFR